MVANAFKINLWRSLQEKEEGFTLVELIVVVVIIGILSSIAIPNFQNASDSQSLLDSCQAILGRLLV